MLASTATLAETVNEFIGRIVESNHDDDNLVLKCKALKEKVEFLLNFLKGDELNKEDVVTSNQTTTAATTTAVAGDEGANGARDKRDRSVERFVIKAENIYGLRFLFIFSFYFHRQSSIRNCRLALYLVSRHNTPFPSLRLITDFIRHFVI